MEPNKTSDGQGRVFYAKDFASKEKIQSTKTSIASKSVTNTPSKPNSEKKDISRPQSKDHSHTRDQTPTSKAPKSKEALSGPQLKKVKTTEQTVSAKTSLSSKSNPSEGRDRSKLPTPSAGQILAKVSGTKTPVAAKTSASAKDSAVKGSASSKESAAKTDKTPQKSSTSSKMDIEDSDEKPKQKGWKKIKFHGDAEDKNQDSVNINDEQDKEKIEVNLELPYWLKDQFMQDKKMRKKNQSGYDPSSLYIPEEEKKALTSVMRQYWEIKSNHFDKLVAFKMWKFYFFYYNDSLIVNKILDIGLHMDGKRFFTYFHESNMSKFAPKILENGHKIVVVEQMEDALQKTEAIVKREVCQVLTRGTYTEFENADYASKFTLCVFEFDLHFGIAYVDTTTHEFYIGEFTDDPTRANLRTLLTRIKPLEIIYLASYIHAESLKIFKSLSNKPTLSPIQQHPRYLLQIFNAMKPYFTPKDSKNPKDVEFPELIDKMHASVDSNLTFHNTIFELEIFNHERKLAFYYSMQALNICLIFLESVMLADTVFSMGEFLPFDISLDKKATLYMDGQALKNLEILDVTYLNSLSENESLFGYIDRTVTPFGKRMLKRWVTSPLMDPKRINERLDAIEDLMKNADIADFFHDKISKFPDFERMINRVYNLSYKQRMSAIYFEDFAKNRLKDFLQFLTELKKVEKAIEFFADYVENFRCSRLIQLTTFKNIDIEAFKQKKKSKAQKTGGIFPRINHIIADLEAMVVIKDGLPLPAPGVSKANDDLIARIDVVRNSLQNYLEQQRKHFKSKDINYVHAKLRYELEIPENLVTKTNRPKDFVTTSKRAGYLRFHSPEIEKAMEDLFRLESEFQQILIQFIVDFFRKFYERHAYWQQVVSCLSELDCLCSLARLARSMTLKCRPEVLSGDSGQEFELRGMVHPSLFKKNPNFVPNDVVVEDPVKTFLITGPNMGGKSTLLRQTCIAVIMAQLGSYVPASYFKFTARDRIFTRIGASDKILEGKSTFFIEMEETEAIVKEATNNSLLIVDELGRGTSTYDGIAIAYAVLKYITEHLNCMTMFSTHYHVLLNEFKLYKSVGAYHMEAEFDEAKDELKFLYKFVEGAAAGSYGTVIAKHAGLPDDVIARAKDKAKFMTREAKNIESEKMLAKNFSSVVQGLSDLSSIEDDAGLDSLIHQLSTSVENCL